MPLAKHDFYPSFLSLKVWWALFWRASLFAVVLLLFFGSLFNELLGVWARIDFQSVVRFLLWKEQNPTGWMILSQGSSLVFGMLPALVLAWWMILSLPIFRTFTLRHVRRGHLAHGLWGAVRLAWSTFWRLVVNVLPLYLALFALSAYQVHLASTSLEDIPYFTVLVLVLMLPSLYLYPLTVHHLLGSKRSRWTLVARPHAHAELLEAFVPHPKSDKDVH